MFYDKVVDYCREKNLSITEFESKYGFGNGTVGKWKDGRFNPRLETIEKIVEVTGLPIEYWLKD